MTQPRWLPVAAVTAALFLGVLGYELGRAGAGGDPAIPKAAAADAQPQPQFAPPPDDEFGEEDDEDFGAPTTRAS